MKTAISIPDDVFSRAEELARQRRISRSALFTQAVEEYLARHREEQITEKLNEVYAAEDSALDPILSEIQNRSVLKEEW